MKITKRYCDTCQLEQSKLFIFHVNNKSRFEGMSGTEGLELCEKCANDFSSLILEFINKNGKKK